MEAATVRAMRGGNYTNNTTYLMASTRYQFEPANRDPTVGGVGFRCAKGP
jgi:hypothetical protein